MSAKIVAPPATLDWLPPRVRLRQRVADVGREIFERAGFGQVVTPTFEDTGLFSRTSGDTSDVVTKEMYSFRDRGDRELTLRPEGTAPVVRAYLEHGLQREPQPVKLWYLAPMFRYARAQRGRYREHWQFGVEVLGSDDPAVDAEVIGTQADWYAELGLLSRLELHLNSIGDPACRPAYRDTLVAYLEPFEDQLSEDSRTRLRVNPLRVLDSKDERDQAIAKDAPKITDHLCEACAEHFASVRRFLDERGVRYVVDPSLVRGLDYYERTAWEFLFVQGGSQAGSISGGGRYDGLAEAIGGPRTPGVGFGCGVERLVLALEDTGAEAPADTVDVYLAIDAPAARPRLHAVVAELRRAGIRAEADLAGRSLKGQLRQASRLAARVTCVCGPEEWARGVVRTGHEEVDIDHLVEHVEQRLETQ